MKVDNLSSIEANVTEFKNLSTSMSTFYIVGFLYAVPIISTIGFLLNVACMIVFFTRSFRKPSGQTFKYIILKTTCHTISLLLSALSPITNCFVCPISQTKWAQAYRVYLLIFTANLAFTYAAIIEVMLSYDRLVLFWPNIKSSKRASFKCMLAFILLLGFLINLPFIFSDNVEMAPGFSDKYIIVATSLGRSLAYRIYNILWTLLLSLLTLILMIIINSIVIIKFRSYVSKDAALSVSSNNQQSTNERVTSEPKRSLLKTNRHVKAQTTARLTVRFKVEARVKRIKKVERQFTKMILLGGFLFSISRVLSVINIVSSQIHQFYNIVWNPFNAHFIIVNYCFTLAYFASNFFTYWTFSNSFKKSFRRLINRLIMSFL
jgi:hypothetical protein